MTVNQLLEFLEENEGCEDLEIVMLVDRCSAVYQYSIEKISDDYTISDNDSDSEAIVLFGC